MLSKRWTRLGAVGQNWAFAGLSENHSTICMCRFWNEPASQSMRRGNKVLCAWGDPVGRPFDDLGHFEQSNNSKGNFGWDMYTV